MEKRRILSPDESPSAVFHRVAWWLYGLNYPGSKFKKRIVPLI
jgi:hypothetical protein